MNRRLRGGRLSSLVLGLALIAGCDGGPPSNTTAVEPRDERSFGPMLKSADAGKPATAKGKDVGKPVEPPVKGGAAPR